MVSGVQTSDIRGPFSIESGCGQHILILGYVLKRIEKERKEGKSNREGIEYRPPSVMRRDLVTAKSWSSYIGLWVAEISVYFLPPIIVGIFHFNRPQNGKTIGLCL